MNDLLDFALDARSGLRRRSAVSMLTGKLAVSGAASRPSLPATAWPPPVLNRRRQRPLIGRARDVAVYTSPFGAMRALCDRGLGGLGSETPSVQLPRISATNDLTECRLMGGSRSGAGYDPRDRLMAPHRPLRVRAGQIGENATATQIIAARSGTQDDRARHGVPGARADSSWSAGASAQPRPCSARRRLRPL